MKLLYEFIVNHKQVAEIWEKFYYCILNVLNELRLVCAFYQRWFVLADIYIFGCYTINAVAKYGTFGKAISWTWETISYGYTVSPSCKKQIAMHWIFNHSNLSFTFFSFVYSFARDFMWSNINGNVPKDVGICFV